MLFSFHLYCELSTFPLICLFLICCGKRLFGNLYGSILAKGWWDRLHGMIRCLFPFFLGGFYMEPVDIWAGLSGVSDFSLVFRVCPLLGLFFLEFFLIFGFSRISCLVTRIVIFSSKIFWFTFCYSKKSIRRKGLRYLCIYAHLSCGSQA